MYLQLCTILTSGNHILMIYFILVFILNLNVFILLTTKYRYDTVSFHLIESIKDVYSPFSKQQSRK